MELQKKSILGTPDILRKVNAETFNMGNIITYTINWNYTKAVTGYTPKKVLFQVFN